MTPEKLWWITSERAANMTRLSEATNNELFKITC